MDWSTRRWRRLTDPSIPPVRPLWPVRGLHGPNFHNYVRLHITCKDSFKWGTRILNFVMGSIVSADECEDGPVVTCWLPGALAIVKSIIFLSKQSQNQSSVPIEYIYIQISVTYADDTRSRNRRQKLASVSGASFSRQLQNFWRQKPTRTNKK